MKRKKVTRQRGHKTHGWGSKKKHRGKGSQGGSGRSGWKHRKLMLMNQAPRKKRFKSLSQKGLRKRHRSINISDMLKMAGGGKKEISLKEIGFEKLLGRGEMAKPLTVKAAVFSAKARQKIEDAGGKALEE